MLQCCGLPSLFAFSGMHGERYQGSQIPPFPVCPPWAPSFWTVFIADIHVSVPHSIAHAPFLLSITNTPRQRCH